MRQENGTPLNTQKHSLRTPLQGARIPEVAVYLSLHCPLPAVSPRPIECSKFVIASPAKRDAAISLFRFLCQQRECRVVPLFAGLLVRPRGFAETNNDIDKKPRTARLPRRSYRPPRNDLYGLSSIASADPIASISSAPDSSAY